MFSFLPHYPREILKEGKVLRPVSVRSQFEDLELEPFLCTDCVPSLP